jgi:DNA-binding winged helix-turn-helix (wHTH) protein/TolB-like protein
VLYRFGTFEFESDSGELRRNGRAVGLEPQPSKALALLVARAGDVVTREEIRDAVWGGDTHVDFDRGVAYCLSQVRSALGDSADNPRFVQTIPKRGFKFIAPVAPLVPAAPAPAPASASAPAPALTPSAGPPLWAIGLGLALFGAFTILVFAFLLWDSSPSTDHRVVIAVSVFDNETGNPAYDRPVAGLSDLVVEHLTKVDPGRIAVIGNAAVLRQPRNIRNLQAVADGVKADYVLLGQLQQGETGLRFITHFIRLQDQAHLKANRLPVADANLTGLEAAVVEEFDRAVREHVLNTPPN